MTQRWLTPEEATARTGLALDELLKRLPHFRSAPRSPLIRFRETHVDALAEGRFSLTDYEAERWFPHLHSRLGHVYVIEAVGADRVKLGFTTFNPEMRRRKLQTAAPFELRTLFALPGSVAVEQWLHRKHAGERVLPTAEWFFLRGSVLELVEFAMREQRWP